MNAYENNKLELIRLKARAEETRQRLNTKDPITGRKPIYDNRGREYLDLLREIEHLEKWIEGYEYEAVRK